MINNFNEVVSVKGYFKLEELRQSILDEIYIYECEIKVAQDKAKSYKKYSIEREMANDYVKSLKENIEYIHLKDKLKIVNYCINVCFY